MITFSEVAPESGCLVEEYGFTVVKISSQQPQDTPGFSLGELQVRPNKTGPNNRKTPQASESVSKVESDSPTPAGVACL
jgi:hypothetical protein